ncbi:MAG: transketolase [Candidatus Yanofskybacteria bacterium]|nr:transketolase [Candidatus Yanofskybacteria bacterium]
MRAKTYKDQLEFNRLRFSCVNRILDLHKAANAGHIGSSLSCAELLIYLHFFRMNPEDKFILSKGHGSSALYSVLAEMGKISPKIMSTHYKDGTYLAAHPPCGLNKIGGIIFGTGSLGHGLSLSAGLALSTKFTERKMNIYCILSDGDCNEGSTWEAAMFAAHHNLNNLLVIIDNNGIQGFGKTSEVLNMESLENKWKSFNFDVVVAKNGNDFNNLKSAFSVLDQINSKKPKCIIAKTIKGNGVSFMQDRMEWHYLSMNDEQYEKSKKENFTKNA